jgi:uncharacterized protein
MPQHGEKMRLLLLSKHGALTAFAITCLLNADAVLARAEYKIATGPEQGTSFRVGVDLAKWVAPAADMDLETLPSNSSMENVQRLRYEPGVKFALVQSDVYQAFVDRASAGNRAAAQLIKPLRVILPLYDEEIYFVARSDAPFAYIHEIKDQHINVGPQQSGSALTATTLYQTMFGQAIGESQRSNFSNEEALVRLVTDKSVDVVVLVAGQPSKLFADMKPEARKYIKLLRLDPNAAESGRAAKTYFSQVIRATNYPQWLAEDVPALAVKSFLVTYDYDVKNTQFYMSRFARALCSNFPKLKQEGHAKWTQVSLELPPLPKGWSYYPPSERELRSCGKPSRVKTNGKRPSGSKRH